MQAQKSSLLRTIKPTNEISDAALKCEPSGVRFFALKSKYLLSQFQIGQQRNVTFDGKSPRLTEFIRPVCFFELLNFIFVPFHQISEQDSRRLNAAIATVYRELMKQIFKK